jgi:hypothetical protein
VPRFYELHTKNGLRGDATAYNCCDDEGWLGMARFDRSSAVPRGSSKNI